MDRRRHADILLVRSGPGNPGRSGQLQQVHQQRLQGRVDSVLGELVHLDVRWLRNILGGRLHGARAAEARGRGRGLRPGSGLPCLSVGGAPTTRGPALVLPVFLHAAAHRTRLAVLHHGGLYHGYGELLKRDLDID